MKIHFMLLILALGLSVSASSAGEFENPGRVQDHILSGGPGKDGIPALTNPTFVQAGQVAYVIDTDLILGVVINGEARAYPENLGWWHEIVNDRIGDQAISVTLCPLTGTGLVFNTTEADGTQFELGVSGLLANSNLIMYDRRDDATLYPQMIYTGINDPRSGSSQYAGEQLELLPVVHTTWGMWKKMYPDTKVPLLGTGFDRYESRIRSRYIDSASRYFEEQDGYPYGNYRTDNRDLFLFAFPTAEPDLSVRGSKDMVLGVCREGVAKAYPFNEIPHGSVINDLVGLTPLVVIFDADSRTAIPYSSIVNDEVFGFYAVEPEGGLPIEFKDIQTGSRWNMLGQAVDGPLAGAQLEQIPAYNSMWFAWDTYYQGTQVWAGEGYLEEPPNTAIEQLDDGAPEDFSLRQNFPNPFNPNTFIDYHVPANGTVELRVYNQVGQVIRTLVEKDQQAGVYRVDWDGRDTSGQAVASGVYLYRLEMPQEGFVQTRYMSLVR
jgi:hypothetical protein